MKKLIFTACMVLTITSSLAASQVGEDTTSCAEMIQSSRNGDAEVTVSVEAAKEVKTDANSQ